MNKTDKTAVNRLFDAILLLQNREECDKFFEDIFTIQELEALSQRLDVAFKLCEGKSYSEVNRLTKASTATISRVGKCINYGGGGYKMIIDRMTEVEK
jgi:TrpR-related protein YerC/YecD